jgi:hypothetical protein
MERKTLGPRLISSTVTVTIIDTSIVVELTHLSLPYLCRLRREWKSEGWREEEGKGKAAAATPAAEQTSFPRLTRRDGDDGLVWEPRISLR